MAYQESVASDVEGLITSVANFAVSQGWTLEDRKFIKRSAGDYDYDMAFLTPPGGGMCVGLGRYTHPTAGYANKIYLYVFSYYEPGTTYLYDFATLAKNEYASTDYLNVWPTTKVYLFGTSQYVHAVVETAPNSFHHFGMGTLDKCSNYVGGQYAYGHQSGYYRSFPMEYQGNYYSDHGWLFVRADLEGLSNNWKDNRAGNDLTYSVLGGTWQGANQTLVDQAPNSFNGQVILAPITTLLGTTGTITAEGYGTNLPVYYKGGTFPETRILDITNLNPGDELTLGPDVWKVFPLGQKNSANGYFNSANRGVAFRKIL